MKEFGHDFKKVDGVCLDQWGVGPFVINVGGEEYRFEDSVMFGPALLRKDGQLSKNPYPPPRSSFWRAHDIWARQGRRVFEDGETCIWHECEQKDAD